MSITNNDATMTPELKPDDRVTWRYEPRGGYGSVIPVAGIVRKVTAKRVIIEVVLKVHGEWVRETKSVLPEKLSPRTRIVPELGETE
jgi:hypothetical protein